MEPESADEKGPLFNLRGSAVLNETRVGSTAPVRGPCSRACGLFNFVLPVARVSQKDMDPI